MENRLSSSGTFFQDVLHWRSSRRFRKTCKSKTLNLQILKEGSSACQFSMTSIRWRKKIQKYVIRIPNKSRTTQKCSRVDIGHFSVQETKKNGTERTLANLKENGTPSLWKWWHESKNLVIQYSSVSVIWVVDSEKKMADVPHASMQIHWTRTFLFRTIHSANQLSIYVAVPSWCGDVAQRILGQNEMIMVNKVRSKGDRKAAECGSRKTWLLLVQAPRRNFEAVGSHFRECLQRFDDLESLWRCSIRKKSSS